MNIITAPQAAKIAQVDVSTVRRWAKSNKFTAQRNGKNYIIDKDAFQKFIKSRSFLPPTKQKKTVRHKRKTGKNTAVIQLADTDAYTRNSRQLTEELMTCSTYLYIKSNGERTVKERQRG